MCVYRLIKYKPNTLEADYTYEIHEEANLGLNIDLIDPAKYEGEAASWLSIGVRPILVVYQSLTIWYIL